MNDKMKLMMDEAWKQWHGNDIDTRPAFERGFRVALEMLAPVIDRLTDLMERSDMEEFGVDCQPVTNGEWFPAIEKAKATISHIKPKGAVVGRYRCCIGIGVGGCCR